MQVTEIYSRQLLRLFRLFVQDSFGLIENDPVGKLAVIKFGMDQGCSNCAGCGKVECMSQV